MKKKIDFGKRKIEDSENREEKIRAHNEKKSVEIKEGEVGRKKKIRARKSKELNKYNKLSINNFDLWLKKTRYVDEYY